MEDDEIKINLDAKQLELIADSLGGRQEAMKKKDLGDWFSNLTLIPSIMKLSEPERLEENVLRIRAASFISLVNNQKLFMTEDDFNPKSIMFSPTLEELQAKNRNLQNKVIRVEKILIANYDDFVMNLLHKKGFFNKSEERKA